MRLLFFVLGAGVGAPLRHAIDKFFRKSFAFPFGILIVNVLGSFILGYEQGNYFVMGFCGAFTTWSAFMLDIHSDFSDRKTTLFNIVLTFGVSIAAVVAGAALAQ